MGLLPDIVDGELVMTKEERKMYGNALISPERKRKFAELMNATKARHVAKEVERAAELNNLGHKEVTEDFEDSPHADREPLTDEEEESNENETEE